MGAINVTVDTAEEANWVWRAVVLQSEVQPRPEPIQLRIHAMEPDVTVHIRQASGGDGWAVLRPDGVEMVPY